MMVPPPVINSSTPVNPLLKAVHGSLPSTPQTTSSAPSSSASRSSTPSSSAGHASSSKKQSDLFVKVKYTNTLPDIPFDPKFIAYPFDPDRFTKYKPTSLEKEYKHELLTEMDLGVKIDLVNPDAYITPANFVMALEDEKLIEDDSTSHISHHGISEKRSKQHSKVVPWLKKTEYISNEFNRYGASSENNETKVGYNVQKKYKEDKEKMICMDREGQIMAIQKTFEEAKKPIVHHHSKKGVTAVEVLPVFPDFHFWKMPFAQVSFDAEPVQKVTVDGKVTEDREGCENIMKEAMIRGVEDASGEQFVAYFLPTEETLEKRKRDAENGVDFDPDQEYEYKQTRDYTWAVKNKSNRGYDQNYFFVTREEAVYYNELETRVKLTKRRNKGGQTAKSKLLVKHRDMTEQESKAQSVRLEQLKAITEDEEDVHIDVPEPEAAQKEIERNNDSDDQDKSSPKEDKKKDRTRKRSQSSSSSSSDSSGSGSESSSSDSESGDDDEKKKRAKKDAEEIFGSDSD